jgi:hypothetical protein
LLKKTHTQLVAEAEDEEEEEGGEEVKEGAVTEGLE